MVEALRSLRTPPRNAPEQKITNLKYRVVTTQPGPENSHVGSRCSGRFVSLIVPRLKPKRQLSGVPVNHNGAVPLDNGVGKRIQLGRLAFDFTVVLHAFFTLDHTCLDIDE